VTYASTDDITTGRLPGRSLSGSSKPNTTQIAQWITEAESMLHGRLAQAGVSTPITDSDGIEIMKAWACDYATGQTLMALSSGADDQTHTTGKELIDSFKAILAEIPTDPSGFESMLSGGSTSESTRRVRSYPVDNSDGKSISDGDFDPTFTRDEVF